MTQTGKEKETSITGGKRSATLDRTRAYMGSTMSTLIHGKETGGRINFMEYKAKPGNEPPPHIHKWENEIYYLLEGTLEFFCEGMPGSAIVDPNGMMVIPAGKAHAFYIHSPVIRTILMTQATGEEPVRLDSYFTEMSEPAKKLEMDQGQETYAEVDLHKATELAEQNGMNMLSPEETAKLLPDYPGFGTNLKQ